MALVLAVSPFAKANEPVHLRIGVLAFGTVNWTLKARELHRPESPDYRVTLTSFAGGDAALIALQGGAVDMVVNDWLWVARQRAAGGNWRFYPYSQATGALLVPRDSQITAITQLKNQSVGVAGGPLDKSWLLLRAYGLGQGIDLSKETAVQFVSPPFLNQLATQGTVEAALNFWHYSARLEAVGFRSVLTVADALTALGISTPLPLVGWVFSDTFATAHSSALNAFLQDTQRAAIELTQRDDWWETIKPLMRVANDTEFAQLKTGYSQGVLRQFGSPELTAAAQAFEVLRHLGGEPLLGAAAQSELDTALFWPLPPHSD